MKVGVEVAGEACHSIHYLEHVQAVTSLSIVSGKRGDVSLSLHSPQDTHSNLLQPRYLDNTQDGIKEWPFLTVQSWGEQPLGKWVFTVKVDGNTAARLEHVTLVLYGVGSTPESVAAIPDHCHTECKGSCARPGPRYCDSCKHYRLSSTLECVPSCPTATYQDLSMCRPCPTNCSHCTSTKCLSCQPGNILLPQGTCSSTCPLSTFRSSDNACTSCHPSCLSCNAAGASNCTKCASQQYKLNKGRCVLNTTCTSGSYFDHRTFECRPCHGSCAECRGNEAVDCTACFEGWLQVDGHCVQDLSDLTMQCGVGQYFSELLSNCTSCPTGCRNCSDDITCTQCQPGFFLQPRAVGQTAEETLLCHASCLTGYYPDLAQQQCRPCPPSCSSCTDPSSCLSCAEGGVPVNGTCSQPCASGEYFNITMRQCLRCSSACSSCKDGYSCTSCVGKLLLTEEGRCLSSCPQHTVADLTTRRCKTILCHHSCATCRGPEPNDCLSCSFPRKLHQHTCLEQCPHNAYPANASCKPCHTSCATCGGPLASDCDSCPHGRYLDHYHCVEQCSAGAFPSDDGRCLSCPRNCLQCSNVHSCSRCMPSFIYLPAEQQCVTACPVGQYSNGVMCQRCPAPCTSCLSAQNCTSCSSGHALLPHQGSCLTCCTEHTSSPCCDCTSSQSCVIIRTPSPSPSSTLTGSAHSSLQVLVVGLLIAALVVVAAVVVVVIVVVQKLRGRNALRYTALHQAHDGLSITVDDHMDSESENEVYVKQNYESVPI